MSLPGDPGFNPTNWVVDKINEADLLIIDQSWVAAIPILKEAVTMACRYEQTRDYLVELYNKLTLCYTATGKPDSARYATQMAEQAREVARYRDN